jgi:prepilin-type N-terminal cleavage/methylation domain
MQKNTQKKRGAFTLVELLVVISIIAIIAALVIGKFSGVTDSAAESINLANLGRISSAVESYSLLNEKGFNRLDLVVRGGASGAHDDLIAGSAGAFSVSTGELLVLTNSVKNTGLDSSIASAVSSYGAAFPPLLTQYYLTQADVAALKEIGITYVMRDILPGARTATSADGEWGTGSADDPDTILCIASEIKTAMSVPVVNPAAVSGSGANIAPLGALVYQACGQDVRFTYSPPMTYGVKIDGVPYVYSDVSSPSNMLASLKGSGTGGSAATSSNGGLLLAFGLGQYASLIGSNKAGFDSAPVCPIMKETQYRRYFLLFRLQTVSGVTKAQFAGVMDSKGNTAKQLRAAAKK